MADPHKIDSDALFTLIDKIKRSGALGRSPQYGKLLDYFAKKTLDGEACSEMSVGVDVFGKGDDFDVTVDSTVRVYVYNLRNKLGEYYAADGQYDDVRLSIPKGDYRLVIDGPVGKRFSGKAGNLFGSKHAVLVSAAVSALIAMIATYGIVSSMNSTTPRYSEQQLQFWGGILSQDKPTMIVVGDYYIFGEVADEGHIRLVREFDINSAEELRLAQNNDSSSDIATSFDLALTYLPRGSAFALAKVHSFLQQSGDEPRITMMSEFDAEDLRENNIVYIGYLSGLSVLESYVFDASRFAVGGSYDVVLDDKLDNAYTSSVIRSDEDTTFVDYGMISSLTVADDSQVIVIAGTRDAGMMEMSELATESDLLSTMQLQSSTNASFHSVFEVTGFGLTNISSKLVASE